MEIIFRAPFQDPSGYSYSARKILMELTKLGVSVTANQIKSTNIACKLLEDEQNIIEACESNVPVGHPSLLNLCIPNFFKFDASRFGAGYAMLESDRISENWAKICNLMDLVLVPTSFNYQTFEESGVAKHKLAVLPLGVDSNVFNPNPTPIDSELKERWLPDNIDESFVFFANFEWVARKNPNMLLDAFCNAFEPDDKVVLVLKTYNIPGHIFDASGNTLKNTIQQYLESIGRDKAHPRIILIPSVFDEHEMAAFYRLIDCYVSPTSGEGWALPLIEAMATGKPGIITNWSGHLEYFDSKYGYLIDVADMIPVPEWKSDSYTFYKGSNWARPSLVSMIKHMRHVYEHQDEAKAKGEDARRYVQVKYSWTQTAQKLISLLNNIENAWQIPTRKAFIQVDEKLKVAIITPGLRTNKHLKNYTHSLVSSLKKRSDIDVRIIDNYAVPAQRQKISDVNIMSYQFEYTDFTKYMLERELINIKDKKVSITQHALSLSNWYANRVLTMGADQIIVHSKDIQQLIKTTNIKAQVDCIPYGYENYNVQKGQPFLLNDLYVGTVGRLTSDKGFIELILALNILEQEGIFVTLDMYSQPSDDAVSKGYKTKLDYLLKYYNIEFVNFHEEPRTPRALAERLEICDMIVLPYHEIAFQYGLACELPTCISSLTPMLVTDTNRFAEVDKCVGKFNPNLLIFPEKLAQVIKTFHNDISTKQLLLNEMQKQLRTNSWDAVANKYMTQWKKLIGRKRNG